MECWIFNQGSFLSLWGVLDFMKVSLSRKAMPSWDVLGTSSLTFQLCTLPYRIFHPNYFKINSLDFASFPKRPFYQRRYHPLLCGLSLNDRFLFMRLLWHRLLLIYLGLQQFQVLNDVQTGLMLLLVWLVLIMVRKRSKGKQY